MRSHPPRLAVWLLTQRLAAEWRDFVLGDLEEEFAARREVSPPAARRWYWRQALRCCAAPPRVHQQVSAIPPFREDSRRDSMLRTLAADLRYALRVLFRTPSFTAGVVVVLALGIGANTAIFSIVNAVLLRPLPFSDSGRLVRLFHEPPQNAFPGIHRFSVSPANFYDWQRDAHAFDAMALYRFRPFTLTGGDHAEAVTACAVGKEFFAVVGAAPALGRVFRTEEDSPARGHVVILSAGFWKTHFGASRDVIGRTLTLSDEKYTIVGVMPAWFSLQAWGATAEDIWVPVAYTDAQRAVRDNHNDQVIARLSRGATLAQAQSEMDVISKRLEQQYPQTNAGWGATVVPLQELIVGDVRTSLVMLLAAVGLVLLIACANVGNLLFTRALGRRKELAVRAALGAGRGRVFQQLLVEAVVLAAAGGLLGLLLARIALRAGGTLMAAQIPRADEVSIDGRVLLFVIAASLLTGILAGAVPAFRAGRSDLNEALKEGGRQESAVGVRTRRLLIVVEVALSLVLLMGAGVMVRSLLALHRVDAGYDPHGVLTMGVSLPKTRYPTGDRMHAFFDAALRRLRALPGVESAGAIDDLPSQGGSVQPIVLEGHAELLPRDQPTTNVRSITPGYLHTMRIPVLRGRDVADGDKNVLLVSRTVAQLLWGTQDPIGRRVTLPLEQSPVLTVIGIVGDVKQEGLSDPPTPTVYQYAREMPMNSYMLAIRTSTPPASLATAATAALRAIDPQQPIEEVRTMDDVLNQTLAAQRFSALLLALFAAVALVLASVGIYSVLSYIVRGRSQEIGVRTALGAQTGDVVRLVVAEGMKPALVGIGLGVLAALGSAKLMETLVFGVSASDPATLVAVATGLALIAFLASAVPAWRASRLDPVKELRGQ
ncbi:MAG TPA: ADOP family duplicated permease [Vicinamibacterales bacterium]|nr:ADOP family duplicated permease [Vicinamibacterales bacterium]